MKTNRKHSSLRSLYFFLEGNLVEKNCLFFLWLLYGRQTENILASLFIDFFLEGNPNKKGKKGKKREKYHFHIYSRKQRCSLNLLSIFSLFPFFLQKKTFLKFLVFEWHEMCTKYPDRKNKKNKKIKNKKKTFRRKNGKRKKKGKTISVVSHQGVSYLSSISPK